MKTKDVVFTEDIYLEHLGSINGVKFTPREIDVMACLLSARRTSQIASMLSIAPRTVSTHFRNIMLRLDCNSQEGIINFVERSHKLSILREYYSTLIIELAFKKALKEISKLKKEYRLCLIIYWQNEILKKALISHLGSHLTHAGISAEIREQKLDQKIENVDNPNQILVLLIEKKDNLDIARELGNHDFIDLSEHYNYYLVVFEILQELLPDTDLKSIFKKFREQNEGIHSLSVDKYPPAYVEEKLSTYENQIIYNSLQTLKNRKKLFVSAFLIICVFVVGALILKGNKEGSQNYIQAQYPAGRHAIRSDLVIPAETSLLHRPELISQIDDKFKGQNGIQTVALLGPGGAGKTTLAREYAHQQKANVIWEINAETHENLERSFENLADALSKTEEDKKILRGIQEIKNSIEKQEKIIQFVKERLRLYSNWFLIYDNVEKFTDIHHYFPQDSATWGYGKILLTTRDGNIQNNKHVFSSLQLGELSPHQKLNLFTKIIRGADLDSFTPIQNKEAREFLEKIPSFPLDVSVAAYYIKATNVPYTRYLERLTKYDNDFENIQENLLRESGDYKNTRYKIITLSIGQLIKINKNFEELLLFISLLDSQNIPIDLLIKHKNEVIIDDFIYHLKKYSLVVSIPNSSFQSIPTLFLHRSTQAISLAYLKKSLDSGKIKNNLQTIVDTLQNYILELLDKSDIEKIKYLIGHCEILLTHNALITRAEKGMVQGCLGCIYYCLCNNYEKAQQLLENGLINLNSNSNDSYGFKARFLAYLGTTNKKLGNFERAKSLLEKSIFIYKSYIPENYDGFAWALSNLGDIYRKLGDVEKAKDLLEQSIKIYNLNNSSDYIGRARALVYLGVVYRDLGNYVQSKLMYEQSLKLYQKYLPSDYIRIGRVLAHSGNIHKELGNYYKSKELILQSLSIYQKRFPADHIDIGWVLLYLGNIYRELKEYEEAQKSLLQSLTIYKKHYSEDHIEVVLVVLHLGNVYKALGQYQKAKELITKSLAVFKNHYGEVHTETAKVLRDLGQVNLLEGHTETAEDFLQRSLEIFQKNKHSESYKSLESLAELYMKKADNAYDKENPHLSQNLKFRAISYLQQALEVVKTHFPEDSPHITRIQHKLNQYTAKETSQP